MIAGVKSHFTAETRDKIPAQWCTLEKMRGELDSQGKDSYGVCLIGPFRKIRQPKRDGSF